MALMLGTVCITFLSDTGILSLICAPNSIEELSLEMALQYIWIE